MVLREVADTFRKIVRAEDLICRYGGEEFTVIMPDVDEAVAMRSAEMIREAVANVRLHFRGELLRSVTVSVGIAIYPSMAESSLALIRKADNALYGAKHGGRNQVQMAMVAVG